MHRHAAAPAVPPPHVSEPGSSGATTPARRASYATDPVLVVMGVSGSGKSTVAALLAERLGWDSYEGDDLHPDENVAKMAAGTPLDDDDRAPWLDTVSSWIVEHAMAGVPGVITCSALKRSYRDVLREHNVVFVYLRGSRDLLGDRMAAREGHFMPTSLLDSQVATLEPPQADERHVVVDAGGSPADEVDEVIRALGLTPVA
jgi:carbohydrate kinase (thermoresistant glucokinase family)